MDYFGLSANRAAVIDAREKVANYNEKTVEQRLEGVKSLYSDEYAAMQGVVTISQAEATFIDLNIWAFDGLGDAFAEFVPLAIGEVPIYKLRQEFEIRVNMGHLAGGPPMVKFQTLQSGIQVTPFQYFSEEFLVPNLVNVNFNIAKFHEKEKALARLAHEMLLKRQQYILNTALNQPLNQLIATSIPAYYNSTPYAGRTPYILDPQVQAGSVESTNIVNVSTEGGLTKNVFRSLRTQSLYQDIQIQKMFISLAGKPWEAYWNQASVIAYTAGEGNQDVRSAIPPSKWEEVIGTSFTQNGQFMNWFGMNVFVQPTNIMPEGYFICSSNKPAVMGWDQMDAAVSDEDPLQGKDRGLSKRYEARSIALAQADPQLRNFIVGNFGG